MYFKAICICSLVSLGFVNSEPPSAQYGAPISSYGTPNYHSNHNNQENNAPKSYEFGYQVKDEYTGNNYKRQEASDGNQVNGEYRVQLPDGRTQIVTYYADWQSGFHADVRYEGTATYPENYGNGYQGGFGGSGYGNGAGYSGGSGFGGSGYNAHHGGISNQYGAPGLNAGFNGGNLNGFNSPATSSVSIKDYSGPGTPYNTGGGGGNYGGYGNGQNFNSGYNFGNGGFDSYSNGGNFGSKIRPSATYGAP